MWYNNLDVVPYLEVLEKQSAVYASKPTDMLGSAISLPGLAVCWAGKMVLSLEYLCEEMHPNANAIGNALVTFQPILNIDTHRL